jgi:hypothetical protein
MTRTLTLWGHPVRIFPESDAVFWAAVSGAVAGLADQGERLDDTATVQLEIVLRRRFYRVVLEEQNPSGELDRTRAEIYVFRDGRPSHAALVAAAD